MSKKRNAMPMQPIVWVGQVIRFKENKICRLLLETSTLDLNKIALIPDITREEHEQFAQLIGYSVSGFGDLDYASKKTVKTADNIAEQMSARRKR